MPLDLWEELPTLLQALEEDGIEYALAGAGALAVHGVARATSDIDLLVPPSQVEKIFHKAKALGFRFEALPMRFSDGMEIRRTSKVEGDETLTLDLLLVNENLETVWAERQLTETEFGPLWVVSRQGLIQMKAWAGREQDLADIRRLEELDR